jgi:phenylalanyl-tRNA synthetase beta chain
MKVTINWLNEYVDLSGLSAEEIAEALTMAGLEVEVVQPLGRELECIVAGRVLAVEKHPEADKLVLCQVDAGQGPVTIVCGAPNVRAGITVPVAVPGVTTPGGQKIQVATIRKRTSFGMLCSERELGLSEDHSGIMILPEGTAPGRPLSRILGLEDTLLEVNITPNRGDCLSHLGIARELAAIYDRPLRLPAVSLDREGLEIQGQTSVTLLEPDHCPRYAARLIRGVTVGPSPRWLRQRLESVGLRSISNIVDITNWVLLETGQPLHAFDYDLLAENRIVVRTARPNEPFTTLDGVPRVLSSDMLVIADGQKAVALAGIMGGLDSEIRNETRNVLLESAFFDPVSIRRTAKKLGLSTEASVRFERGVDLDGILPAADRAARLMQELGGGTVVPGVVDQYPRPVSSSPITLDVAQAGRFLGIKISMDQALDIGRRLGLPMVRKDQDRIEVRPPAFRRDLSRPVDLMEELARLIGYDRIPSTYPRGASTAAKEPPTLSLRRRIEEILTGLGFDQIITYSFIAEKWAAFFSPSDAAPGKPPYLALSNPLSEDQAVMRTSLLPGLLSTLKRNLDQRNLNLRIFEVGNVFYPAAEPEQLPRENTRLGVLWSGKRYPESFHQKGELADFYDLKGVVEGLLEALQVQGATLAPVNNRPGYGPEQAVRIVAPAGNLREIGEMGEIAPAVRDLFGFREGAYVLDLDLDQCARAIQETPTFKPWPRYPEIARDIALILDEPVTWKAIQDEIHSLNQPLIEALELFDLYRGKPIPAGKKNLGIRLHYRSAEQTLTDEMVSPLHQQVVEHMINKFRATLPGAK